MQDWLKYALAYLASVVVVWLIVAPLLVRHYGWINGLVYKPLVWPLWLTVRHPAKVAYATLVLGIVLMLTLLTIERPWMGGVIVMFASLLVAVSYTPKRTVGK